MWFSKPPTPYSTLHLFIMSFDLSWSTFKDWRDIVKITALNDGLLQLKSWRAQFRNIAGHTSSQPTRSAQYNLADTSSLHGLTSGMGTHGHHSPSEQGLMAHVQTSGDTRFNMAEED